MDTPSDLQRQQDLLRASQYVSTALDRLPVAVAVVNANRDIVYVNRAFVEMLSLDPAGVLGLRLGAAANCRHSDETPGGCGTTAFCATCGALRAQQAALQGDITCEECRIVSKSIGHDLTLRVWARPAHVDGDAFAVLTLLDIADEKRRESLQRVFFHDILNTAGGVQGIAALLPDAEPSERDELVATLAQVAHHLVEEIQAERDLLAMERGDFASRSADVSSADLLERVAETYRHHELAAARTVRVSADAVAVTLETDATLLRRVLGNMTKNALEACPRGGVVTLSCSTRADRVVFSVHGPSPMPPDVQLQIFQRSFSTKGAGRGLGTYSMKLISEGYLHGSVSFVSTPEHGTTFFADYPRFTKEADRRGAVQALETRA